MSSTSQQHAQKSAKLAAKSGRQARDPAARRGAGLAAKEIKASLQEPALARRGAGLAAIEEVKANLRAMNAPELVALVGEVMSSQAPWKHLRAAVEGVLRAAQLAPMVEAALVDVAPRVSLDRLGDDLVARARIVGEAKRALVTDDETLSAADVSRLLGSRSGNQRQYANRLRSDGELLALPVANQYVYPAFQIDVSRKRVHPEIKMVGDLLGAADDPWGVWSWWGSPNSRIGDRRPRDLLGTAEAHQLRSLAEAIVDPVG
jgi:hypothetical protein